MQQHLARDDYCRSCFGTRWLMGLSQTLHLAGDRLSDPTRALAEQRLNRAIKDARKSVLASGQFALQWGVWPPEVAESAGMPALPSEPADLISHQGHMLAWVLSALTDAQLAKEDWPHRAAGWLARALTEMKDEDLEAVPYGAHSHAVQALRMYRQRVEKLPQGA